MRRSDMKVGEEYVSNGARILVLQSPDANWYTHIDENGKQVPKQGLPKSSDPLGVYSNKGRPRGKLWFKAYNFDAEGKRIEEPCWDVLVDARDIKGTWAEYLDLYAEKLAKEAEDQRHNRELNEHRKRVAEALLEAFSHIPGRKIVTLDGGVIYSKWGRDSRFTSARLTVTLTPEQVAELVALSGEERTLWKWGDEASDDEDEG